MKSKYALLVSCIIALIGCKDSHVVPNSSSMPPALVFALLDKQGNSMLTGIDTPVRVYSIDQIGKRNYLGTECNGGGCTMVREVEPPYNFVYVSLFASTGSLAGIKTWYIELGGKTDTLYYDVRRTHSNDPLMAYDLMTPLFNGKALDKAYPFILQREH